MADRFDVLVICTANICRSPAAERLLRARLARSVDGQARVSSAGTHAVAGAPACDLSSALVGEFVSRTHIADPTPAPGAHVSRPVTPAMVDRADLILTADREHRAEVARLVPQSRPRTFTLRHAAELALAISQPVAVGDLPAGAPPLPAAPTDRLRWLVAELDAARGATAGAGSTTAQPPSPWTWHPHDIPDPHVVGYQTHPIAIELLEAAVVTLCDAIDVSLSAQLVGPRSWTTYD